MKGAAVQTLLSRSGSLRALSRDTHLTRLLVMLAVLVGFFAIVKTEGFFNLLIERIRQLP